MLNSENNSATILEIQRMSTEDGPGLRTTIFFKGCSLHCSWCHNPESISPRAQVHWIENRCIGCKICLEVCPRAALSFTEAGNEIDRVLCNGCGLCADECPAGALELLGEQWELDDLVAELIKDKAYFDKSGGGVTLSGGEPTLQAPFAGRLLQQLKNLGIHTALDTCGLSPWPAMEALLPTVDLVLYDLKVMDSHLHRAYTGSGNEKIAVEMMKAGASDYLVKGNLEPETLERSIKDSLSRFEELNRMYSAANQSEALKDMARVKPVSPEEFSAVFGIGEAKLAQYGEIFTKVIREYLDSERADRKMGFSIQEV